MTIQDDHRETELIQKFKLKKSNHTRIGIDAKLDYCGVHYDFEVKSTTTGKVSTASPLHLEQLEKWKNQYWIIGIYDKDEILQHSYVGTPAMMKEWLSYWKDDIQRGLKISDMLVEKIDMNMVYEIFGDKDCYKLEDVKYVFKKLCTTLEYEQLMDRKDGFSKNTMLKLFKRHNKVYLYRGSALNNPKIPYSYYKDWPVIDKDYANKLRKYLRTGSVK